MFNKTTEYIDKLIEEKGLPLLDVTVIRNHRPIYRHFGSYNGKFGDKELLCMFSCTKVLTAVSGMQLVEEGKIALDDPVSKYIPEFENAYTVDENGEKHREVITVRHLFAMTSGFDYGLESPEIVKLSKEKYDTASTADVINTLINRPLNFKPGERFLYSLSHDALGVLIEKVEKMSLAEYMQKHIFEPLGMKNSTMDSQKHIDNPPRNHYHGKEGFYVSEENNYKAFHPTKNYVSGGAGLISTVEDFAIFADTLASGGTAANGYRLIKPETIEKMKEIQFDCLDIKSTYTCPQGEDYGYGLGVRVRKAVAECGIPKGEFGWDGAAGSYILVDTDNGISITMGMNILNWQKHFRYEHTEIAKRIYEDIFKNHS